MKMRPALYKHCICYIIFGAIFLLYLTSYNIEQINNEWNKYPRHSVQIWAKAAIADFLWFHLLNGKTQSFHNGFYNNGKQTINDITFYYLSGPGYIQTTVPQSVEHLILVLNGRTSENVAGALTWLEYIPQLTFLKKLAVIMLGNEHCEDAWISKYLKSKGGPIDILFMVYDSPLVDDKEVFQWPLGVATYRHFPKYDLQNQITDVERKYLCNFAGTVYKGSSREVLRNILKQHPFNQNCLLLDRDVWPPQETADSLERYINILRSSDYTLCPVGLNTECYRLYEAMSIGSIPVVEDNMTPGHCISPLRLLKKYSPPVIFIKDWRDLNLTLLQQRSSSDIKMQRIKVIEWYNSFKTQITDQFISIINNTFFHSERSLS